MKGPVRNVARARRIVSLALSAAAVAGLLVALQAVPRAPIGSSPAGAADFPFKVTWQHKLNDVGAPIAEGSPIVATLDPGGPAAVVGDRSGHLYAFHLSNGSAVPGWPADAGAAIDSTPSVAAGPGGFATSVFVGAGNAADDTVGGYLAFGPGGNRQWSTKVEDPNATVNAQGVQASLTNGTLQGAPGVVAGSLDQQMYALNAQTGGQLRGWPFFTSDSTFSTAALADLYGTGQNEIVVGGDQTKGFAFDEQYNQGGHVRVMNDRGGLICHDDLNQTVSSSPAVGGFLPFGRTGIVVGTGSYFPGASDTGTVKAFDTDCHLQWSATLDGDTSSSPALADVLGNGQLQVVEGTRTPYGGGSVYAINGDGTILWSTDVIGPVLGSVVTADLFGEGYQDVLVPTYHGVEILDGQTGRDLGNLETDISTQNSPLVTDDPDGRIGITIAGYDAQNQGVIRHYEVVGSSGAAALSGGSWPMFHHDPTLSGDAGGTPAYGSIPACSIPAAAFEGYDQVSSGGSVFSSGMPNCGSMESSVSHAPIVGMAMAPNTGGYWLAAGDGGVFTFGGASFFGSMGGKPLNSPIVGIAATPDGGGYWLAAADGGVFTFGDARFFGAVAPFPIRAPIVAIAASNDGQGYRLVGSDGSVFTFGDAENFGGMGGQPLAAPIVGIADEVASGGYWLVAADGGVFSYDAPFLGGMGGHPLAAPVTGIESTSDATGYRLTAADGGLFSYSAPFFGNGVGKPLNGPIVGVSGF